MKERGFSRSNYILILFICLLAINILGIIASVSTVGLTGYVSFGFFKNLLLRTGSSIGQVFLIIEGDVFDITIDSPENITYNFSVGENYTIELNVSATQEVDTWWYDLWDRKHERVVYQNVIFSPNSTFNATRWENQIIVYANNSAKETVNKSVFFYVNVPNTAPIISALANESYVCEDTHLSLYFNATDVDEQILYFYIHPSNPFYVAPVFSVGDVLTVVEIFSGLLRKDKVGRYQQTVYVRDPDELSDSKMINITVIEVNHEPVMDNIGVQTIWGRGEGSNFYNKVNVSDKEDGDSDSVRINFNISFLNSERLFNITSNGIMNFTPENHTGIYNISVCCEDSGLRNPHENISLCNKTGDSIDTCQNFSLTITDENRQPNITSFYPLEGNLSVQGTESLYFNISKYDPDATIPDAYWYVDDIFKEYDSGSSEDNFIYIFGCGISGEYVVKADITDGELNDSVEWNVSVEYVECSQEGAGGGGGGAGRERCEELWACDEWENCQNLEVSYDSGFLDYPTYSIIKKNCSFFYWKEDRCGFQLRNCEDVSECNTTRDKPEEIRGCLFVKGPSCFDGVRNCHHDGCELLIDCGGPCDDCPTCSDNIQNQGEEGVDCGGPCLVRCEKEEPVRIDVKPSYVLVPIAVSLLVLIFLIAFRIIKIGKQMRK
jgi:hypothetical protein